MSSAPYLRSVCSLPPHGLAAPSPAPAICAPLPGRVSGPPSGPPAGPLSGARAGTTSAPPAGASSGVRVGTSSGAPASTRGTLRRLMSAAGRVDDRAVAHLITDSLETDGALTTWLLLCAPALAAASEPAGASALALTAGIRAAFDARLTRLARPGRRPTVMLTAAPATFAVPAVAAPSATFAVPAVAAPPAASAAPMGSGATAAPAVPADPQPPAVPAALEVPGAHGATASGRRASSGASGEPPLAALAAVLLEHGVETWRLGADLPWAALSAAVTRAAPAQVVIWSSTPSAADAAHRAALESAHPSIPVVPAGPGWPEAMPLSAVVSVCLALSGHR